MDDPPRPAGAWMFFAGCGALLGAHAVYLILLPTFDPRHWRAYTSDPVMLDYLADDFRASGGIQLTLALFVIVAAATWLRRGDPVAWWLFWSFPLLLLWEALTTWIWPLWLMLALASIFALMSTRPAAVTRQRGALHS